MEINDCYKVNGNKTILGCRIVEGKIAVGDAIIVATKQGFLEAKVENIKRYHHDLQHISADEALQLDHYDVPIGPKVFGLEIIGRHDVLVPGIIQNV